MTEERYDADDANETILVDRSGASAVDDGTVVVDRGRLAPVPAADGVAGDDDDDDDRTIIKQRPLALEPDDDDDGTIIRDRAPAPANDSASDGSVADDGAADDGTIVVDRDDKTVVRERAAPAAPAAAVPAAAGRRGRRRITLPPVEPGFGAAPVDAVGPGAVDAYVPRPVQQAPAPSAPIELGADASRAPAPSMPSVARSSRALGFVAVGGFAAACLVSVVGLAAIVVALLP